MMHILARGAKLILPTSIPPSSILTAGQVSVATGSNALLERIEHVEVRNKLLDEQATPPSSSNVVGVSRNLRMDRLQEAMVARTLEIEPELLPWIPELLADFDALGSDVARIVELLRAIGIDRHARVVDLGSGKGALSIALARDVGCDVTGIDLFQPFVESSALRAQALGLQCLCLFRQGDIIELAGTLPPFDAAIIAALGDVVGDLADTVAMMRLYVKPGGYLCICDGYLERETVERHQVFENYPDLETARRQLVTEGDRIVLEWIDEDDAISYAADADSIRSCALRLAEQNPELRDRLMSFVESQAEEYRFLEEHFNSTIWILQRGVD